MRNEVRKSAGRPCSNLSHKLESLMKFLCVLWIIRIDCNKLAFTSVIIYLDAYSMNIGARQASGNSEEINKNIKTLDSCFVFVVAFNFRIGILPFRRA